MNTLDLANLYLNAGLSIIPVGANKKPAIEWDKHKHLRATIEDVQSWPSGTLAFGIVGGPVSGFLEILDFDDRETHDKYWTRLAAENPELAQKLTLRVLTPRDGWHFYYRCELVEGSQKLASRPLDENKVKVLIETRGTGGYVVAPGGSAGVHPSGKRYQLQGEWDEYNRIPVLTSDERDTLLSLARQYDEMPVTPVVAESPKGKTTTAGLRPGDDFNERATWEEVLQPHGWRVWSKRGTVTEWTRPGKSMGVSATTGFTANDTLMVFSTSTSFATTPTSYTKFTAYAILNHGGDFVAAATDLAKQGYGDQTDAAETAKVLCAATDVDPEAQAGDGPKPWLVNLATIKPRRVSWLWDNVIPAGKVTVFAGDPGLGKSFVTLYCASQISTGEAFHGTATTRQPAGVIIINGEDDIEDTIVPRLIATGANLHNIDAFRSCLVWQDVTTGKRRSRYLDLSKDIAVLEQALQQRPNTKLVIIDPISVYLGKTDTHRNSEVRAVMAPIEALAQKHGVAILCIHHLNKGSGSAINRVGGSIGFVAAARTAWTFAKDPNDPQRRLMLPTKSNLTGDQGGMSYQIVANANGVALKWGADQVNVTADEALSEDAGPTAQAVEMVRDLLLDGPQEQKAVASMLKDAGFGPYAVRTAKRRLNVVSRKVGVGLGGKWYWELPPEGPSDSKGVASKSKEVDIRAQHNQSTPLDIDSPLKDSSSETDTLEDVYCPPEEDYQKPKVSNMPRLPEIVFSCDPVGDGDAQDVTAATTATVATEDDFGFVPLSPDDLKPKTTAGVLMFPEPDFGPVRWVGRGPMVTAQMAADMAACFDGPDDTDDEPDVATRARRRR